MTYAARITALPLPEPTLESHEHEVWGQNVRSDFYTAEQMKNVVCAAACVAYDADTELSALRDRQKADMEVLADAAASMRSLNAINAEFAAEVARLRGRVEELERSDEYEFCVYEGDERENGTLMCVASGTSSDLEEVKKEAFHYAAMYSQDGPVTVEFYAIKRTKIDAAISKGKEAGATA